jgi:putative oxidoreductase
MTNNTFRQFAFFLLRVAAGVMFFQAGATKLWGWFGGIPGVEGGVAVPLTISWWAGLVEVICGGLIAVGLLTRVAAFIASGEMAVAYFMVHLPNGWWPQENNGVAAVLYCFLFFYMVAHGAGQWSLDYLIGRGWSDRGVRPARTATPIEERDRSKTVPTPYDA